MALKWFPFYNVEKAVGSFAPNQMDDVMLVQFMISRIASTTATPPVPKPATPLTVDGMFTPAVSDWISWFQKVNNAFGSSSLATDGRIDPARGEDNSGPLKGSISQKQYTITALNYTYRRRFKASHDSLEADLSAPGALRQKLASNDPANN